MDVGFENPLFACLEIDYEEADNDPTGKHVLLLVVFKSGNALSRPNRLASMYIFLGQDIQK